MSHFRAKFLSSKSSQQMLQFSFQLHKFPTIRIQLHKSFMGFDFKFHTKTSSPSNNYLLSLHIKNKRMDQARVLFDEIPSPDLQLYTKMISGYASSDRLSDALLLFDKMPVRDVVSWNSMVKGCLDCGDLGLARRVFDRIPDGNVVSWTTMINGYLKFGRVEEAEMLFWDMPERDVAAWNAMIHGYFENGRVEEGMRLFKKMPSRNVISWTSVISGLDQNGDSGRALFLFREMVSSGLQPTSSTFACVLTACANAIDCPLGLQVHCHIVKLGYCFDEYISASLITLYAVCKRVEDTEKVFYETLYRNVVIWTALLTGFGLNNKHEEALCVFGNMIRMSILPNQSTLTSALNSSCKLEVLDKGKVIHTLVIKLGLETDVFVGNSLIVMYTECGNLNNAVAMFKTIKERNVVSWNSIIVGSAQHGCGIWALIFFCQMVRAGVDPDEITITGLLSACSRSGMLQKGRYFFEYFSRFKPNAIKIQHYACMVDILGRCGKLDEAEDLVKNMPMKPNTMVWLALLSACRMHSNLEVAERVARTILHQDPYCSAAYVLLSNLYASAGRWTDVAKMRVKMKEGRVMKERGCSWVVLRGKRHEFLSGDRSHPLSGKIYEKLDWLGGRLKEFGYIPDQRFALHDVEGEQKEEMLAYHSERLAVGFGLISTVEGSTIVVMKNLRVCGDCHSAIKLISKIVGREIVVRDASRFHHFKNGMCSCGDYW